MTSRQQWLTGILSLLFCLALVACSSSSESNNSPGDSSNGDSSVVQDTAPLADLSDSSSSQDSVPADQTTQPDLPSDTGTTQDTSVADKVTLPDVTVEPDLTQSDGNNGGFELELDKTKLLISGLTGDIYKRLAIVGNLGIIRVNPTPAPKPDPSLTWTVTAEIKNTSKGDLIFARPVKFNDQSDGRFSLLADADSKDQLLLTFKLVVRDKDDNIVDQSETDPVGFSVSDIQTLVQKKIAVNPTETAGQIFVSASTNGKAQLKADKLALDPVDSLAVMNISKGTEATFKLQNDVIDETLDADKGDVLVIFSFQSDNTGTTSSFLQYIVQ